ncbi:MAG: hypothetical protein QW561_03320, partial [Candidatus Aenigmatarchaeota archaeon]
LYLSFNTFPCGKKIIKKTPKGITIWDKGMKNMVAECKRQDIFQPLYLCHFDVPEREQLIVVRGKNLYAVQEITCSSVEGQENFLCDGSVLTVGKKKYCILYQCLND